MAGENAYKEFDTASVITTSTTKDTVSIGRYALRKRELLLGVIAIAALVGVLILAIVLAVKASDFTDNDSSSHNAIGGRPKTSAQNGSAYDNYCHTPQCLKVALYQKPIMNEKGNPCQDFYSFACGHYADHHPQTPIDPSITPYSEIIDLNSRRLVYLTLYPIEKNHQNSYERKLQEFMSACENHYDKMSLKGTPMLDKVITPMGGWWVFGDDVLTNFDLQTTVENSNINFWTSALFNTHIKTNINNWNHVIVEMDYGGVSFNYYYYMDIPDLKPIHDYYKQYMKDVATMLTIDKRLPIDETKIATFADDTFEVEQKLAMILSNTLMYRNPHHEDNLLTLSELNEHMNGTFDFVHFMKNLFNENPSMFSEDTKVAVTRVGYFDKLGVLVQTYLNSEDGPRKLHNFLMWRVIYAYVQDLSWEYIHLARQLNYVMYDFKDESSGFNRCFRKATQAFTDAWDALFYRHFVTEEGKKEAKSMTENIKEMLLDRMNKMPWMTRGNRDFAMKKIKDSMYNIGFPLEITDDDYLNSKYSMVSIDGQDHLGNVLQINKLAKHMYNRYYANKGDFTAEWSYPIFYPVVDYHNPWKELIITSAFLQSPLYSTNGPTYFNYGGAGSIVATNLIHAFDEVGANYKEDGSNFENWWANATREHYATIRKCAIDAQHDEILGPFLDTSGNLNSVNSSLFAPFWAPQLLAESSGARLAYMAFKTKEKKEGLEKLPPGFSKYSTDQMFFISYAQAFCQNTPDNMLKKQLFEGQYPGKNRVNLAMQQVPEFHRAFDCPATQTDAKQCLLFNR